MFKLQFKDQPQRSVWLVGENFKLGASADNDLVITGLGIDELHAEITIEADHLVLRSKAGGCFVNDLPVGEEHRLVANDELRIGKQRLLIIDPKQTLEKSVESTIALDENTGWSLLPVHPKLQGRDFSIVAKTVIGRSGECRFTVPYKLLSREHAELSVVNGELLLKDLGSANGCFVNGEKVEQLQLHDGDKVSFAKLAFTVQGPQVEPLPEPAPSYEELNKTMIRPAVNLEQELQRAAQVASGESLFLPEDSELYTEQVDPATNAQPSPKKWLLWTGVAVVAIAAVLWFSPLNTLQ